MLAPWHAPTPMPCCASVPAPPPSPQFGFARSLAPQGLAETLCGSPLYMVGHRLFGWSVGWLAGWGDFWSVGWLAGWPVGWLAGWNCSYDACNRMTWIRMCEPPQC